MLKCAVHNYTALNVACTSTEKARSKHLLETLAIKIDHSKSSVPILGSKADLMVI